MALRVSRFAAGYYPFFKYGLIYAAEPFLADLYRTQVRPAVMASSFAPMVDDQPELSQVIERLVSVQGSLVPFVIGSPVIRTGDRLLMDLHAASDLFGISIEYPVTGGGAGNARAEHFEYSVQSAIDSTEWKPSSSTALLRKVLRLDGNDVTDIDALAELDGTLLLIDCKSRVYSAAVEHADFRAFQNNRQFVEEKVHHWNGVIETLRASPVGDNYDLSRLKEVLGVVCTPFPVYVEDPAALEEL